MGSALVAALRDCDRMSSGAAAVDSGAQAFAPLLLSLTKLTVREIRSLVEVCAKLPSAGPRLGTTLLLGRTLFL
jgi:hypothetical protein